MKTKQFVLVFVFITIIACAIHPREKKWGHERYSDEYIKANYEPFCQQTLTFDGLTYDQVWDACELTLIRMESVFYTTNKASGEVRVGLDRRPDLVPGGALDVGAGDSREADMLSARTYTLSILISIADKRISVQASILVPILWNPTQRRIVKNDMDYELNRFMHALKIRLKK